MGLHTGGKWFIYGTKYDTENQQKRQQFFRLSSIKNENASLVASVHVLYKYVCYDSGIFQYLIFINVD